MSCQSPLFDYLHAYLKAAGWTADKYEYEDLPRYQPPAHFSTYGYGPRRKLQTAVAQQISHERAEAL